MITESEKEKFYQVAHHGLQHDDPNFVCYGQELYKDLRKYDEIVQLAAKERIEERIRRNARQIERNRTSHR